MQLLELLSIIGYWQCLVPECELTKPIFGNSDSKSMLVASTLIEVWWAARTLVNWPFCCVDRHLVVPEYLWKLGWHPLKVLCAWKMCKSAKSCVNICLVIFAKPSDCSSKQISYKLLHCLYHFKKITGYYFEIKYMYSSGHIFFKSTFNAINALKLWLYEA